MFAERKQTKRILLVLASIFIAGVASDEGCCSLKFKTCDGTWCGTTEEECLSCSGNTMQWLPNGSLDSTCSARWTGCANNDCCPGLTCRPNNSNWLQCLTNDDSPIIESSDTTTSSPTEAPNDNIRTTLSPTGSPTFAPTYYPTELPTVPPTKSPAEETGDTAGCCSHTFLTCDGTWCGTTKEQCESCSTSGMVWLPNGELPAGSCFRRWLGCGSDPDGCCAGARCRDSGSGWMQCLADSDYPAIEDPTPTASPTFEPTAEPSAAPVTSPTDLPTSSPTLSPTVKVTAAPVISPTEVPTNRLTLPPTDVPTTLPTATPTDAPVVVPTTSAPVSSTSTEGVATYYGGNENGNACGFIDLPTATFPYEYASAAGGDVFDDGYGCGSCYEITCTGPNGYNPSCVCDGSSPTIVVQVNDQCPECSSSHFDLNPKAFEDIVGDGLAGTCGVVDTLIRRVSCPFERNIRIRLKSGTSQWWLGLHVDYVAGYGDLSTVRLRRGGTDSFDVECDKSGGPSYWLCHFSGSNPLVLPVDVQLVDSAGRVLTGDGIMTSFTGGSEFDFGSNFGSISGTHPVSQPTSAPFSPTSSPVQSTSAPVVPTNAPTSANAPSTPTGSSLLTTDQAMNAWDIYNALDSLTHDNDVDPPNSALIASGGIAGSGDVVSEGQGYALLILGTVLASWDDYAGRVSGSDRDEVINQFGRYFRFWQKMCQNSYSSSSNCQPSGYICSSGGVQSVCLPDWKSKADGSYSVGTGAAPDGDVDGIVGIIFAVKAVANDPNPPDWYDEARKWADASATAFFTYDVTSEVSGYPLVKLGPCWGGWGGNGNNPSYHSPGSYKIMRDYQASFPDSDRSGYSAISTAQWNALIDTTYEVLEAVQVENDGAMVPNWVTVGFSGQSIVHTGGYFSGSGTPQNEYGSEATRTTWRVAMDAALYPNDSQDWERFLTPFLDKLRVAYTGSSPYWPQNTFPNEKIPNTNFDVYMFSNWMQNGFIYGPTLSALIIGDSSDTDLIDAAGQYLEADLDASYYARCWGLLASLTLSGALENAGKIMTS